MPRGTGQPDGAGESAGSAGIRSRSASHELLRCSHIFASVVREVLESKPLRAISPCPLTPSQLHLLALMARDGEHHMGKIADSLGVSAAAATKNIDKLERLGLVVRSSSSGDRRATILTLSGKGRRLVRKYGELKAARLAPVLGSYRDEEIWQFARLLEKLSLSLLVGEPLTPRSCLRCDATIEPGCSVGRLQGGCPYQTEKPTPKAAPGDEAS